jgi:hypothetical protein
MAAAKHYAQAQAKTWQRETTYTAPVTHGHYLKDELCE